MNEQKRAIAVNYMDISDEISIELELEKLKVYDKEKSEFISNISHELRTPLNIFYSTIQLLDKLSIKEDSDFKLIYEKYKKTLHLNCKRMLKLINNVIDISRIDIGLLKANFENYDIVSIVEDVTLSVVNYALLKSINIQFDTNKEEHIIKCDSSMIERMMLNLLSNAIKFSQENKNIYVKVFINDEWVQIDVQDEGMGISKNAQQFIFEKFIQADKSFTRMNEGSGIGLSIVKSIINLHEGDIYVDSEVNEGSTLKILLPDKRLESLDFKVYDINKYNIELELSDIYQILV
jgi:signal transduction histidine kinase